MFGAIIGDIAGSRFEFINHRDKDFELFTETCRVTDDSIMTLAIAKAIMEAEKIIKPPNGGSDFDSGYYSLLEKMAVKYMREIGRKYPDCGYGGMFLKWVFSDDPQAKALSYLDDELRSIYNDWSEFIGNEGSKFKVLTKLFHAIWSSKKK